MRHGTQAGTSSRSTVVRRATAWRFSIGPPSADSGVAQIQRARQRPGGKVSGASARAPLAVVEVV